MNVSQAMTQYVPLAADTFDKNKVTPGILGFLVFAALALGVWALMKSMNRHMGRVSFEEAPESGSRETKASPTDAAPSPEGAAASVKKAEPEK
ncbi:hypothetical protein [Streptomyces sp. NPDC051561]|uniref:hypothetical protein n=1 Tax=Streptomyces sp. NPDC051561 TaxID=3365658 RepID=UPI0037B697D8